MARYRHALGLRPNQGNMPLNSLVSCLPSPCNFKVTGQEGKLFGSVTNADIFDALKEKGFERSKKKIILTDAIKHVGIHMK